jgi:hypothetical protein
MFLFLLLSPIPILAWNFEAHFLIARIAYDLLESSDPAALAQVTEDLRWFQDPTTLKNEDLYPFVESVSYADEIKRRGGGWQSQWHFDNIPMVEGDASAYEIRQVEKNITSAMP